MTERWAPELRWGDDVRSRAAVLLRRVVCCVLPRGVTLRRRLADDLVFEGPNRPGYGGRGVYILGTGIEEEIALLPNLLGPGDVFVDVGANSGIYTVLAARLVGDGGRVVAVEPNPEMADLVGRNVRNNGLANVSVCPIALSDRPGRQVLYHRNRRPNQYSLIPADESESGTPVQVETLDALGETEGLTGLTLLKIDVEGAENAVLEGGRGVIERHRPTIIAEAFLTDLALPPGYAVFQCGGSPNFILVPDDRSDVRSFVSSVATRVE